MVTEQAGLFDRAVDDELMEALDDQAGDLRGIDSFEQVLTDLMDEGLANAVRKRTRAKNALKKLLSDNAVAIDAEAGDRVRFGRFVVEFKERHGGDVHIPNWEKIGVGSIKALD